MSAPNEQGSATHAVDVETRDEKATDTALKRPPFPIISHYQTSSILKAGNEGKLSALMSLDLGLSTVIAAIHPGYLSFPDKTTLSWDAIEKIDSNKTACFYLRELKLLPVRGYSETYGRSYSLMPTPDAPALFIAGFPMHRIKNITPCQAASAMIGTIAPFRGSVLDTATGLGYTAIEAAKTAGEVITIELDPMALEMAGFNPWSRSLFTNQKIIQVMGNSLEKIGEFPGERFSSIIHDPPSVSLAGELYSGEFYKQTYRVLKPHGRMFHYIGDPTSAIGARTTKGVQKRLRDAGFRSVALKPSAYGVLAEK